MGAFMLTQTFLNVMNGMIFKLTDFSENDPWFWIFFFCSHFYTTKFNKTQVFAENHFKNAINLSKILTNIIYISKKFCHF